MVAGVLYVGLAFFVPVGVYHVMGLHLVFAGALLCGVSVFMALSGVKSWSELRQRNKETTPERALPVFLPFFAFIFSLASFAVLSETRTNNLLKEKGVSTVATIGDKNVTITRSVRRGTQTDSRVQVSFVLQDGTAFQTEAEVSGDVFGAIAVGERVDVRYLPEDPSIFVIVAGDRNVQRFAGVSNRDLEFEDLEKILELPMDDVEKYLNGISVRWEVHRADAGYVFANSSKEELVGKNHDGSVVYSGVAAGLIRSFRPRAEAKETTAVVKDDPEYSVGKRVTTLVTSKLVVEYVVGYNTRAREPRATVTVRRKD